LADGLEQSVREFVTAADQNLGDIELAVERQSQELLRAAAEKAAQKKADVTPPLCPVCQRPLSNTSAVLEHLTGVKLPRPTLDREARRQGQRARQLRCKLDEQACQQTTAAVQPEMVLEPYQIIIQMDAWNIRERDGRGQTGRLRQAGQEPERWHWVYTGACFRLDHRGKTAAGRLRHDKEWRQSLNFWR
jgi:hypothetical protein